MLKYRLVMGFFSLLFLLVLTVGLYFILGDGIIYLTAVWQELIIIFVSAIAYTYFLGSADALVGSFLGAYDYDGKHCFKPSNSYWSRMRNIYKSWWPEEITGCRQVHIGAFTATWLSAIILLGCSAFYIIGELIIIIADGNFLSWLLDIGAAVSSTATMVSADASSEWQRGGIQKAIAIVVWVLVGLIAAPICFFCWLRELCTDLFDKRKKILPAVYFLLLVLCGWVLYYSYYVVMIKVIMEMEGLSFYWAQNLLGVSFIKLVIYISSIIAAGVIICAIIIGIILLFGAFLVWLHGTSFGQMLCPISIECPEGA